jgi:hypothetical protein
MQELRVDMFSTVDGYGASDPPDAPYGGATAPPAYTHGSMSSSPRST